MENGRLTIRAAAPEDGAALLNIYRPYVERTAITFEYEVPAEEEFALRLQELSAGTVEPRVTGTVWKAVPWQTGEGQR